MAKFAARQVIRVVIVLAFVFAKVTRRDKPTAAEVAKILKDPPTDEEWFS